jgi:ectoine hydroxylase-related dioxygenase (phytanoyl-CoA dioxygenase family)
MKKENLQELREIGFTIVRNLISPEDLENLSKSMDICFNEHKRIQIKNGITHTEGVSIHSLVNNKNFIDFLETLLENGFIEFIQKKFFKSKCILNSFSALNNIPNKPNFSSSVHRDLRFYSGDFPVMVNCLIMIDDFTLENGGTYLLPYSHLDGKKPSDKKFFSNCVQAIGKAGDILIFNSNLWHASAPNTTDKGRKAIPFTLSKSFMKQLLDYPRAIGYDKINDFSYGMQQLLGYHSRVPASLEEWYQNEENRFYKKNQD